MLQLKEYSGNENWPYDVVRPYSTCPVATSLTVQMMVALFRVMFVAVTALMLGPEVIGVVAGVGIGVGVGARVGAGVGVGVAAGVGVGVELGTGVVLPCSTETAASISPPKPAALLFARNLLVEWADTWWVPGRELAGTMIWLVKPFPESTRTVVPVAAPSHRSSIQSCEENPLPWIVTPRPGIATPDAVSTGANEPAPAARNGTRSAGTRRMIGIVARMSRRRRRDGGRIGGVAASSSTQRVPFQNIDVNPFRRPG